MNEASITCPWPIHAVVSRSSAFAERSGLYPLTEAVQARACLYKKVWPELSKRSWRLGHSLRCFGQWYYRSEWNSLIPLWHDLWMCRRIPRGPSIVHFLFSEFAAPRHSGFLRRRGAVVIGTFHASVRRQVQVHGSYPLNNYDWISVVSSCQIPFFVQRGYPKERIRVTPHGVDTDYYFPLSERERQSGDRLKLLLVGSTERDHAFMGALCRALPEAEFETTILTDRAQRRIYQGIPCVRMPGFVTDEELLLAYQQADLFVIPLHDCTANNAILEAMSCGTPVMVNRAGGVPEYVADESNFVMNNKTVDDWVDRLRACSQNRAALARRRPAVRKWAEGYSWSAVAGSFRAMYHDAFLEASERN